MVDQSARSRQRVPAVAGAPAAAAPCSGGRLRSAAASRPPPQALPPPQTLSELGSLAAVRRALEREARQARLVRQAVVLGEKEYCVIVDADGKREIKVGPARVFPGPYDVFMVEGSTNRVYDAYELLPQRALWLRVIAPISRDGLAARLPRGFALDEDAYYPGDELLLTGVSTFFVPFNEIEVLSPQTGEAVVGNDHRSVFIEAIGIDQKSGIYVRDLADRARCASCAASRATSSTRARRCRSPAPSPPYDWNLWIAGNEPHKRTERRRDHALGALHHRAPQHGGARDLGRRAAGRSPGPCVDAPRLRGDAHLRPALDRHAQDRSRSRSAPASSASGATGSPT